MKNKAQIPSAQTYAEAINSGCLKPSQLKAIQTLYGFPTHSATAGQVAAVLGYAGYGGANFVIGNAGKSLSKAMDVRPPNSNDKHTHWWSIVAEGNGLGRYFLWVMRPQLINALETLDLATSEVGIEVQPDEEAHIGKYEEGNKIRVEVNIYERSREARQKCIKAYGCICSVCGFDFHKVYGEIGQGFTHVHHLVPLSELNQAYVIDPIRDLRPVCPNCHAMIHRQNPALTIEQVKGQIMKNDPTNHSSGCLPAPKAGACNHR